MVVRLCHSTLAAHREHYVAHGLSNDFRTLTICDSEARSCTVYDPPTTTDLNLTIQTRMLETDHPKMSKPSLLPVSFLYLVLLCLHAQLLVCNGFSVPDLDSLGNGEMDVMVRRGCSQKIGECLTETEMDSEINRRLLVTRKKYISYETLRKDMTPCSTPGASYYNCHSGQANPYNRGCAVITRCARGISKT